MTLIYLSAPYGGIAANLARARRWLAWAMDRAMEDEVVIAPWILSCEIAAETPQTREAGIKSSEAVAARCDEVWLVGGRVSEGMAREAAACKRGGGRVEDLTHLGEEPPDVVGRKVA